MRTEVFIGIDISKLKLDGFNLVTGKILEFENNPTGIKKFLKYARKAKPTLITCESTGGLEQPLLLACTEVKLPISVLNPRQVRSCSQDSTWRAVRADFAKAILDHKMHLS